MRITSIVLVIKRSFDQTNLQLFLHYFWLLLNVWTTVQPFQVLIISMMYYFPSIVLWGFIFHLYIVDYWDVCLPESDQRLLILKLVLRFVRKLSVGCIQTGHTSLFPPQVCGRFWWGCRLGVHNCAHKLIAFIDLKYFSSYFLNPSF